MYFVVLAMVLGAGLGGYRAKARKGSRLDIAQYAGVYAILFGLAAMIVVVILLRSG